MRFVNVASVFWCWSDFFPGGFGTCFSVCSVCAASAVRLLCTSPRLLHVSHPLLAFARADECEPGLYKPSLALAAIELVRYGISWIFFVYYGYVDAQQRKHQV